MEPQNREVGKKLLNYTVLMFSLPIAVFYACNDHVFQGSCRRFPRKAADACALIVRSDKPVFLSWWVYRMKQVARIARCIGKPTHDTRYDLSIVCSQSPML